MNQRHADSGADELQMSGGINCAVIAIKRFGQTISEKCSSFLLCERGCDSYRQIEAYFSLAFDVAR